MAREKRIPYIRFYTTDWRGDVPLRMCSFAARGLWIDLLTLMHEGDRAGYLLIAGQAPKARQLAALLGGGEKEITRLLNELREAGVFSVDEETGAIVSRRMIRDAAKADLNREWGLEGGNPEIRRGTVPKEERVRPYKRSDAPQKTLRIFQKSGGKCHWCDVELAWGGEPGPNFFHVDHVVAICDGGTNDEENLVASCAACNHKRARDEIPTLSRKVGVGSAVGCKSDTNHDTKAHGFTTSTSSKRFSTSTSVPGSANAAPDATGDDAAAIIAQFDESRSAAFGAEQARQWPNQTDHLTAKKLIEAGATPAFCRPVFDAVNAKLKAKGFKPRDRLSAMEGDVASALEAKAKPAAAATATGPAPPRLVGMDESFVQDVTLRLVRKRGGKHGLALQEAYAADPAAGLAEAKRLDAELREEARGAA